MTLDSALPVWSVAPNWSNSIIETLTWKVEALTSNSGAEQTISYRLAPRRSVEALYSPDNDEQTFLALSLQRLGRNEWMMPLWFDAEALTAQAVAGSTRLALPTANHEFAAGGMAYVRGADAFSGEAVQISTFDGTGLNLAAPLGSTWAAGTTVHPMRRGRFEDPKRSMLTSRLSEVTLRFNIERGNDLSSTGAWGTTYSGFPVLTDKPDWTDNIEIDLSWLGAEFDPGIGRRVLSDTAGRAFKQTRHAFMLSGAAEKFAFRQMLYRLRGQQKALWLPSQADDFTVAVAAAAGALTVDVNKVGYAYVGGPAEGADHLYLPNGQIVTVNSAALIAGLARERLTIGTALTSPLAVGDRFSFAELCRLAGDSVEIEHLGDSEGVATSTLAFRGVSNKRTATTATQSIPAAAMSVDSCGSPETDNGCAPKVFEGWYAKATLTLLNPSTTLPGLGMSLRTNNIGLLDATDIGAFWPNGVPKVTLDATHHEATFYFVDGGAMTTAELRLTMQFLSGTVSPAMNASFSWVLWNETGLSNPLPGVSSIISPGTPSFSGGNPFHPGQVFPDDWFFAV